MELLVFDLGHVLIDFEWMSVCYAFSERSNRPSHEVLRAFSIVGKLGYEIGKVNTEQFLQALNKELSTDIEVEEFTKLWNTSFRENEHVAQLLAKLKDQYQLCILSNTNECHYSFIQENFDVERHFHEAVLSYREGYSKPAMEIYQAVTDKTETKAENCLFIDDLEPNIEAARRYGMKTIHFANPAQLVEELTAYGIKA